MNKQGAQVQRRRHVLFRKLARPTLAILGVAKSAAQPLVNKGELNRIAHLAAFLAIGNVVGGTM